MKYLLTTLIKIYHIFVSPFVMQVVGQKTICRYKITCSQYAVIQIEKHGIIKGSELALRRILSCRSW